MDDITDGDVELCRYLATKWHAGQLDKNGQPYIGHLERVAARCTTNLTRAIAWLHDAIEDVPEVTSEVMRDEGVPEPVVYRCGLLNRKRTTDKLTYYADIADDPPTLEVKDGDIADNTEPWRLDLVERIHGRPTRERLERKYDEARLLLGLAA